MKVYRRNIPGRVLRPLCRAAAVLFLISMTGCACVGQAGLPGFRPPASEESAPPGWWYASFQIYWPEDQDPSWHVDPLIAHRIVYPILESHENEISLWRFHRRAARDASGHKFSFIFQCPAATARQVYREIRSSGILAEMKSAGVILQDFYDDTSTIARPNIESTSDPSWSLHLQRSWPFFIMGVSETWLDLIRGFAGDGRKEPRTPDEMLDFYRDINQAVEETWKKEGAHAFLHHLNALFGYEPLNLGRERQIRF